MYKRFEWVRSNQSFVINHHGYQASNNHEG